MRSSALVDEGTPSVSQPSGLSISSTGAQASTKAALVHKGGSPKSNPPEPQSKSMGSSDTIGSEQQIEKSQHALTSMPIFANQHEIGLRRSSRTLKLSSIAKESTDKQLQSIFHKVNFGLSSFLSDGSAYTSVSSGTKKTKANNKQQFTTRKKIQMMENLNRLIDGTLNSISPILQVFGSVTDNETYTYKAVMEQPDFHNFIKAMEVEIEDHTSRQHWLIRKRKDRGYPKTILAIWSFKRKRFPDGRLNKHKARLCAHGGMQQWGIHYWETFLPVVNWLSVQLILIISIMENLPIQAIDFVLAFPQANPDVLIFMELPVGFTVQGRNCGEYIIKLNKLLYGLKQSGLNWFEKLKQGLLDCDFIQLKVDPCVFISNDTIVLTYVEDCLIL